jgi:hypothetical protein
LRRRREDVLVEELVASSGIEALDAAVLHRLARVDEVRRNWTTSWALKSSSCTRASMFWCSSFVRSAIVTWITEHMAIRLAQRSGRVSPKAALAAS